MFDATMYSFGGFIIGLLVGHHFSMWHNRKQVKRPVNSKPPDNGKADRDIPRFLTVIILVLMIGSVGGLVWQQQQRATDRHEFQTAIQSEVNKVTTLAHHNRRLTLRTARDESLLRNLVLAILTSHNGQQVTKALHKYLRESKHHGQFGPASFPGSTPPGVTPMQTRSPPTHPTHPSPQPSSHPQPTPTHPAPHPTHHPSPHPSATPILPLPLPSPLCTVRVLGRPLCG